jgi:hypothetical protein
MNIGRHLRIATLVLLVAVGWPEQGGAARRRTMEKSLEPLGRDAASDTTSLRLVSLGGPHLAISQFSHGRFTQSLAAWVDGAGELKTVSVATDNLPTITTLPGPPPDWDALAHADGSIAVVWTVAGSAVSHLAYKGRRNAAALTVNRGTPFGVLGGPRFVSGSQRDSLVAIASLSDQDPSVVLFRQRSDGAFEGPRIVEASWRGIPTGAKLVQLSDGYLVFVKVLPPGGEIPNVQPRRAFGSRQIPPGWLDVVRLNADLKLVPAPAMPARSDVVFELDAVAAGARIALLTTTPAGGTLTLLDEQGHPERGPAQSSTEIHLTSAGPLTSPSLLFANGQIYVAAIRDAGPAARVVGAKIGVRRP